MWADFVDKEDLVRTLIDPTSPYAMNAVNAFGRTIDDVLLTAMRGTAYTGVAGGTATVLPSGQKIAEGNTGMTIEKLIEAKEIFWANDVDPDDEFYICCSGKVLGDMLLLEKVTSADYAAIRALVKGEVNTYMGFNFIRSERVTVTSDIAYCVAWAKSGVVLGLGADVHTRISERADKNYLTQVWCGMSIGATRLEEDKVIEIGVDQTPD